MATSTSDMRLSGGHPALDFANTVDSRRGRWGPDFLRSFDDLLVLAARTAVIGSVALSGLRRKTGADPERARKAVDEALRLREAIHQVFIADSTRAELAAGERLAYVDEFPVRGRTAGIKVWTLG